MKTKRKNLMLVSTLILFSLACQFMNDLFEITPTTVPALETSPGSRTVSPTAPDLPTPPQALLPPPGTSAGQAAALADALQSNDANQRLSAWLGVYQALMIPVIGQEGAPLDTFNDDPIGPRFWQVWYASGLDLPGRGISLTNAGQLLAAGMPGENGIDLSRTLLEDLRSATQNPDPVVQMMGFFVRERILRGTSKMDLLAADATPDELVIDLPTLQLLSWAILRSGLAQSVQQAMASHDVFISYVPKPETQPAAQAASQFSCSDIPGAGSDYAYWSQWLINKIGGGFQLPGMKEAFPGLMERFLSRVFEGRGKDYVEKVNSIGGKVLGYANAVTSGISLMLQLEAMTINPAEEPNPLVRTKYSTYPGNEGTLRLQLYSDPQSIPDGNKLESCLASFFSNALGVSFAFPSPGGISGAEMTIQGGAGFPDLVMFNINGAEGKGQTMRADTDSSGFAYFKVLGAPQKKDVPEIADPVKKEFSVTVKAQPEEAGLNTIANLFFDGLSFGAAPGSAGGLSALVDLLKTFSYDMGEYYFDLQDWQRGYVIDASLGPVHFYGKICDGLDQPFNLQESVAGQYNATFSFTPSGVSGGSWTMDGMWEDGNTTISGKGGYTITKGEQDRIFLNVLAGQMTVISKDKYGHVEKVNFPSPPGENMPLFPATTECDQ